MKRILSTFLVIVYTLVVFQPLVTYVDFVLNRMSLEEEFCINVDKPELDCRASCYLDEQLTIDNQGSKSTVTEENVLLLKSIKQYISPREVKIITFNEYIALAISDNYQFSIKETIRQISSPPPEFIIS